MELIKHEMAQGKLKQTTLPPICYFAEDLPMLPGEAGTRLLQTVRVGEKVHIIIWASPREKLSSGFPTKRDSNQPAQLQIEISFVASLDMIHSNKQITKALIRLHGCTGWSAPMLFANLQSQVFSRCPYMAFKKAFMLNFSH